MLGRNELSISFLGFFLLFAAVLLPDIKLNAFMPAIQLIDFLLPLLLLVVWINRKNNTIRFYSFIPLVFSVYIFASIFITNNYSDLNPYFEVYKMLKIALLILFFSLINFNSIKKFVHVLFGVLVFVNLLHFFNLFGINFFLENYYNGGIHIQLFGLNSLGDPAVKRLVGTMGNPNINGLLFGMFTIFYFPFKFKQKELIGFFAALLMTFLCQSRTVLVIIIAILFFMFLFHRHTFNLKQWLTLLIGTSTIYILAWMLVTSFFKYNSYNNSLLDGTAFHSGSVRGRWESWELLWNMIIKHPIFGYGPNKNFFYVNRIYSENEYLLMTWRYGIIGLLFYLSIFTYPFIKFIKKIEPYTIQAILLILLMSISALTNNPLTEKNMLLVYIFGISWAFNNYNNKESHAEG